MGASPSYSDKHGGRRWVAVAAKVFSGPWIFDSVPILAKNVECISPSLKVLRERCVWIVAGAGLVNLVVAAVRIRSL